MRFVLALFILLLPVGAHAAVQPLDKLFVDLAKADSTDTAKPIEEQILALFAQSGSPSVDLLMTRALSAQQGGDAETAGKLFESITQIAPSFAEGWHERGELQAASGDDEGAMLSLQKTVALNPREFAAFAELGSLLADYGDKQAALAMYRKALALDPKMEDVQRRVRQLSRDVEGQGI